MSHIQFYLQVVLDAVGVGPRDLLDVDLDPLAGAGLQDPLAGTEGVTAIAGQVTWWRGGVQERGIDYILFKRPSSCLLHHCTDTDTHPISHGQPHSYQIGP